MLPDADLKIFLTGLPRRPARAAPQRRAEGQGHRGPGRHPGRPGQAGDAADSGRKTSRSPRPRTRSRWTPPSSR
ncbi:hypothetical protein [Streptomyces thioluteus]|uniref:hypothetical protein n=1 Tax=Streptomyces thioluteus TaxID=66431 RepID=UPI0031E5CB41